MATNSDTDKTARQGRSPAYPAISLRKALERAEQLRRREGKHAVPLTSAYRAWDLGEKGSLGRQTVAALRYFGLVEYEGQGTKRLVKLTETALNILLDKRPESIERQQLVKEVALNPTIYTQMWKEWGANLPSDGTIETYLVRDNSFSETAAPELIGSYKDTLSYSGLFQPDIMSESEAGENDESGHDSDKSREKPSGDRPIYRRIKREVKPGMKEDVFTLKEGDVVFQWPERISPESFQDLEDWTGLLLRKIKRHIILHHEIAGAMDTEYTDDEEGRAAEERDRLLNEQPRDQD